MISRQEVVALKNEARKRREDAEIQARIEQEAKEEKALKQDIDYCDHRLRLAAQEEKSSVTLEVHKSSIPRLKELLGEFRVSQTEIKDDEGNPRPGLIIRWDNDDGGWK